MIKRTVYLEIPFEWEGDPPIQKELERQFEHMIAEALSLYEKVPQYAITVESRLLCASCGDDVDPVDYVPPVQEYRTDRVFPTADNN